MTIAPPTPDTTEDFPRTPSGWAYVAHQIADAFTQHAGARATVTDTRADSCAVATVYFTTLRGNRGCLLIAAERPGATLTAWSGGSSSTRQVPTVHALRQQVADILDCHLDDTGRWNPTPPPTRAARQTAWGAQNAPPAPRAVGARR